MLIITLYFYHLNQILILIIIIFMLMIRVKSLAHINFKSYFVYIIRKRSIQTEFNKSEHNTVLENKNKSMPNTNGF